ncbi:hypothetical protein [Coleofasciculus sp.]|uniref:hypothetical protein n=1 Tax=Coleofasciculus sp. TaxID=3100458 RepID=UPI0039F868EC
MVCLNSPVRVLMSVFLVSGAIAGCTQPTSQTNGALSTATAKPPAAVSPASPTTATNSPINSPDWVNLLPGETIGDLTFTQGETLVYQCKTLLSEIPVSYSSDGTVTYAKRLIVSGSSPSGRYTFIKACEIEVKEIGLCWSIYKVDALATEAQKVNISKYGGLNWVQWSSDERYAVFFDKTWFIVMDLLTGESKTSSELSAQPDLKSFTWTSDRTFDVTLVNGSQFQGNIEL